MRLHLTVLFRRVTIAGAGLALMTVAAAAAQGPARPLGEVAREEAERRKAQPSGGKVYTNKDLPESARTGTGGPGAPGAAAEPADAPADAPAASSAPSPARTEAWWRNRITKAREEVSRNEALADALQSRINALTRDFTSRDNPVQRARVGQDRADALVELGRVRQEIEVGRRRLEEIEDEARRAGIPPGWLR